MQHATTIHDLAKALNLSTATISRALNDFNSISEPTKKRVRALAKEMNYHPNKVARGLRNNKTKNIGILVPNISCYFNVSAIDAIEEVIAPMGYSVVIRQTKEKLQSEIDSLKDLASMHIDGLISSLSAETQDIQHFYEILPSNISMVFIDRAPEDTDVIKVTIDNCKAAYEATKYLLEPGHRKIVWMAGPTGLKVAKLRYEGYCKAHQEAGLAFDQSLNLNYSFDFESGYRVLLNLLNCRQDLDAIFTINDRVAIEALAAVRDAGKRAPEDLSVMGFNNEGFSSFLYPSLTTVFQPSYEMGKKAAEIIKRKSIIIH